MPRNFKRADDNTVEARIVDESLRDLERFRIITREWNRNPGRLPVWLIGE